MNFQVVIPSHKRVEKLRTHALAMLDRMEVPRDWIRIFVAHTQLDDYRSALPDYSIEAGALGLAANRNAILAKTEYGARVLSIDDDVRAIRFIKDGDSVFVTPAEFHAMIARGFESMDPWASGMWGISPTGNNLYMGQPRDIDVGMPKLDAPLFGYIAGLCDEHLRVPEYTAFDDVERECQLFRNGWNVVRFSGYAYDKSHAASGGREDRTGACKDVRRIERLYPDLVDHETGNMANQHPCYPKVRRGRYVRNPRSLEDVLALRNRVAGEPPRSVGTTIHGRPRKAGEIAQDPDGAEIEQKIKELRAAFRRAPAYGRNDPFIKAVSKAVHGPRMSFETSEDPDAPPDPLFQTTYMSP